MNSEANVFSESGRMLRPGDRIRMNARRLKRHPKYGDRQGFVVGRGSPSGWRIKFNERASIQTSHQDYLEQVPEFGADPSRRYRQRLPSCERDAGAQRSTLRRQEQE